MKKLPDDTDVESDPNFGPVPIERSEEGRVEAYGDYIFDLDGKFLDDIEIWSSDEIHNVLGVKINDKYGDAKALFAEQGFSQIYDGSLYDPAIFLKGRIVVSLSLHENKDSNIEDYLISKIRIYVYKEYKSRVLFPDYDDGVMY